MAEATLSKDANANTMDITAPEALSAGEVIQLPDGRIGVTAALAGEASGDPAAMFTAGQFTMAKTASVACLDGGRAYFDKSAGTITPLQTESADNVYAGVFVGDAASADATCVVDINVAQRTVWDMHNGAADTAIVQTTGTTKLEWSGGTCQFSFSTNAEAEKVDILSKVSVPVTQKMIFESIWEVVTACDADAGDVNVGLANGTHASDADSITEACFFHQDSGADLNLDAESDDGTTEVAATDTTVDIVAGTPKEVWIDARDLTDIQMYVDGVLVLGATVFKLNAATGPLKALWHVEKSANDTAGVFQLHRMVLRTTDVA
jgi:predicted RecA/RadA family phage recombinase